MKRLVFVLAAGLLAGSALADRTPAPAGAEVYIISPADGAKVHGSVTVKFGLKGMGIAPAGVKFDNTGHHHLLIDTELSSLNPDMAIPASDKVLHFGKGQTETTLSLTPGRHTLELVLGDSQHLAFDPVLHSAKITITVD